MRKQILCLVALLLLFGVNAAAQQTPSATQVTVIRAGKLIDVDAGRVQTNQMILVRGGKIEAMGENLPIPSGAAMIDLSIASIEHASMIDDEGIALAKEHGTYLDMDIYDEECIQDQGKKNATPADFLEHDRGLGELHRRNFAKAVRAGVKMSFGTDAGVCPHGINARQFAFMVKYGMTPMQAIQSATSNAADLLGKSDVLGSLKPGKYADIIAVSGNPLDDVRLLENVKFVMKEGKIYKQEP